MARLTKEELDAIKKRYNVSRLWSFSRMNTYITSRYEYFLRYVKKIPENRLDCAYATLGTLAHDTLDDYYDGKIQYEDMIKQFEDGWTMAIDVADLKLDRNDPEHDKKLKAKYKIDMIHFFNNHMPYKYKLLIEKPVVAKVGSNVFVGYCDAIYKDSEGNYVIVDFKTSSNSGFTGKNLEKKSMQLIIYAMALMQYGVDIEKIKLCFNMLKYVNVETTLKNGNKKLRTIERCSLAESLSSNVKMWLKDAGYSENEIDDYLKLLLDANNISVLPEEVRDKYKVDDCHIFVPLTQELVDECSDYIISTIRDIMLREKDYEETQSENCFWDSEDEVKAQSYYFSTLSGYSANLHKPYQKYLERLDAMKNGVNIFDGIGSEADSNIASTNNVVCDKNKNDIDLSWLDNIV